MRRRWLCRNQGRAGDGHYRRTTSREACGGDLPRAEENAVFEFFQERSDYQRRLARCARSQSTPRAVRCGLGRSLRTLASTR